MLKKWCTVFLIQDFFSSFCYDLDQAQKEVSHLQHNVIVKYEINFFLKSPKDSFVSLGFPA